MGTNYFVLHCMVKPLKSEHKCGYSSPGVFLFNPFSEQQKFSVDVYFCHFFLTTEFCFKFLIFGVLGIK